MKSNLNKFIYLLLAIAAMSLFSFSARAKEDKLKAEEVVAKHLDSIGTKEKRAEIKNRLAVGASQFSVLRGSSPKAEGKAVIVSETGKIIFISSFNSQNYPFEKIGFDGNKVEVGFITPGIRSSLGSFILSHKDIFSEGLFGGSLSTSWSLLDLSSRKARVESAGKKKLKGRDVYVLDYLPKGGSDLAIKLYFDAQTFQHVQTDYRQVFAASQGKSPDDSARQQESRHLLTEEFSDFRDENGITLPHLYRIYLILDGQKGTNEFEWNFGFSQFLINQKLDSKSFDIDAQ